MKKILLASTMLVGTAGFAAADNANFTWSGSAYAGMAWASGIDENVNGLDINNDGDTTDTVADYLTPEVTASFTAGMKTTTDGGLEAGASITIKAMGVSMDKDNTDTGFGETTWNGTGFVPENTISAASVYLKGDFGKFEVVYDPDGAGGNFYDVNFKYSNTWGDFGVSAFYTVAPTDGAGGMGATNGDMGAKLTYTMGDYKAYAGLDYDASDPAGDRLKYLFGGSATMSGFTIALDADYDTLGAGDFDWKASASYSSGPYSIGAFVQDDDPVDNLDYGVNAAYDLGGGVALEGQYIYDDDSAGSIFAVGVSMKF